MLISLLKDPSSRPGDILAHVQCSASDDPSKITYSHSFRYKVLSGKDGEIIIYANKDAASKDMKDATFSFDLEKCRNKDCIRKNPDGCPEIAGKTNRLLVADIFHTMPTQNTLQYFGTALFKALFSMDAKQIFQITNPNGGIFLQFNKHDDDLDAIPWEYAKDGTEFVVHSRKFARIFSSEYEHPQDSLLRLPLRIVVAAPDPLDLTEMKLADLHLGDQFQNFINEFRKSSIKVLLERVLPATVNKLNLLLAKHGDNMATVFHFMGHCVAHANDKKSRGLVFEDGETFKCVIANTQNLVTVPKNLRLAFLSACDSREVARGLVQNGVRHTIGSYCPLPNDIAHKFEAQFYHYLVQGLSVDEAMWRTRMSFQDRKELRESDYLAGAMILYSAKYQTADNIFLCELGELKIELNMFPNNLKSIHIPKKFFGRKKQLAELNSLLRRMVTHMNDSFDVCTITGIGGQGKTTLAMEAVRRTSHFFPGGIFVWQFYNEKEISAKDYLRGLASVLFPNSAQDDAVETKIIGQVISEQFKISSLLILDHADTLKRAAADAKEDALFLIDWLQGIISRQDIAVKILATSQENLEWSGEIAIPLDGFSNSDIRNGCKVFVESLNLKAKESMQKEENSKLLLRELVMCVDGHPLSLKLLGTAAGSPKYLDKPLKDIVHEHYGKMLVDDNRAKKSLEDCFGSTINRLPELQRQILYICSLFTGPITNRILLFVSHFIDYFRTSAKDLCIEMVTIGLQQLCERGLLFETKKNEYRIHIALWEAVRQRNTELHLRLRLQLSGQYSDIFLVGILMSSHPGKSMALEWLFHELQFNSTSQLKAKNFVIQYYSIDTAGCHIIDLSSNNNNNSTKALPKQLIVFIYKISTTDHDDLLLLTKKQVISIIVENKLPFILVMDYNSIFDEGSARMIEYRGQMKKVLEALQTSLAETYRIVLMETLSEGKEASVKLPLASTESSKPTWRAYQKSITDVYMEGNFVGREEELEILRTLLNDDMHHFITIKGFGGMGKTCLALQAIKNFNSGDALALSLFGTPTLSSVITKIAQFLGTNAQLDAVIKKLNSEETVLFYLDNMEDIKNANDQGDPDAKALMKFFRRMPKNIKILSTSRVALDWPNEEIVELDGLTPYDGMQVFRQWISQRNNEVDDDNAMKLSELVYGHSLSLRLLGGVFNSCKESINQFLGNIFVRLPKVMDNNSTVDRHESINACIEYSFDNLDPALMSLLGQLKAFEIPFSVTLAVKALGYDTISALGLPVMDALHQLWQRSWLNRRIYVVNPMLGDWRPRIIEKDTEFYSLHPRLRDFLNQQFKNVEDASSTVSNDQDIQFYTALCYGVGFGVVSNLDKQIDWCTKAGDNGHLEAQLILALCYETGGGGVGEDQIKASYWYLKAAEAGDKKAQFEIFKRYYSAIGIKGDFFKASEWRIRSENNKTEPLKIKFDFSLPLVHRAAAYNKVNLVKSLLEQTSVDVNIKDRNGGTPLHEAASNGHIDIVKLLTFSLDADINIKENNGLTPTHMAALNGHIDVVRLLGAELGANVNTKDEKGRTPLHMAALNGHIDIARLLVTEFGLDINKVDNDGRTPLHCAAQGGHIDVMKIFMVELGANKDKKDNEGGTLLHYAAKGGIMTLLETDVDPEDDRGWTLLHWAVQGGQVEAVKLLILKRLPIVLDFRENNINDEGACALAESLKQNTTLAKLYLGINRIGNKGACALAESLKQNTTLTELVLGVNEIGNEGARALAESLKQNTTLTGLNIERNIISDEGANALAQSLKQNTTLTVLDLGSNKISIEGARALAESLKQNTTLTELILIGNVIIDNRAFADSLMLSATLTIEKNNIGIEGVRALAESLKYNTTLTKLNLQSNGIGGEEAHVLAKSLEQNTTLTKLDLGYNNIDVEGARTLAESLKQNMALTKLNLTVNRIGVEGTRALAESLKQNTTLTGLNLKYNGVYDKGVHALAESLKQNTTLIKLNLTGNKIGDEGARALAESLMQNMILTKLNLSENKIGIEGARAIAKSLKQNTTLIELNFYSNQIGDEGTRALAKSLKQNMALTKLVLKRNEIGDEGAHALAESLEQNTTLTELNIGTNKIGIEGACVLVESLKQNTTLTELYLYHNEIGVMGARALAESLKQNTTLTELSLFNTQIGDEGARVLAETLKQNTTLIGLDLRENSIGVEGARALTESLKQNTTLAELDLRKNNIDTESRRAITESVNRNKVLKKLIAEYEAKANTNDDNDRTSLPRTELRKTLVDFGKYFKASNGQTPLHVIAAYGHIGLMEMFVGEFEIQINTTDNEGWTPLHSAAARGHVNVVRLLVTKLGADPNSVDKDGRTPLHRAVEGGHIKVMKLLIAELGADAEAKDNNGYTPLHRASFGGHIEGVRMLVAEHSADAIAKAHGGETPLHEAAKGGHDEIVRLLVTKFAADVNTKANNGRTPLHGAAENKKVEVMRLLIAEFGADINARDNDGWAPFVWFARDWYAEVMSLLVSEFGADAKFEFKSNKGQILLHWAAGGKKVEIMKSLFSDLRAGTDIKDNDGQTLIRYLTRNWYIEVARLLVAEYGADPNAKADDDDGQTPLHLAAQYGSVDLIRILVAQFGADTNAVNSNGSTPLHAASKKGHIDVVKLLAGVFDANIACRDNENSTPLHFAASGGHVEVAKILIIDFKADVHAKNDYGLEPLGWAAMEGHVETVKVLVHEFGANLNAKDKDGLTPLQLAKKYKREEVINLITDELYGNDKGKDSESSPIDDARKNVQAQVETRGSKHTESAIAVQSQEVTTVRDVDRKYNSMDGADGNSHDKNEQYRGLTEGLVLKTTVAVVSTGAVICIAWLLWKRMGSR